MAEESAKTPGAALPPATRVLDHGKRQFIIAPCRGSQTLSAGLRPLSAGALRGLVGQIPGMEIVRVLRPRGPVSAMSLSDDEATEVYVVRIDPDRAALIRQTIPPQLVMEEDTPLDYRTPVALPRPGPSRLATWSFTGGLETRQIRFRVVGEGERPLVNVGVTVVGDGTPQEGRTDKRGEVALPFVALPGARAHALLVNPPSNYWDQHLIEPELSDADVNVVRLRAIAETISGFPEQFRYGWGQIQMGLHRIPETLTGKGVRVAIIDSGVDTSHPLLRHVRHGLDLTSGSDPQTWTQDVVGLGSHCAGIIAARDEAGKMFRGFVPEAEIHVLRVMPGGRLSSVIEALNYCLEREVDVVSIGVSSSRPSRALEQKIEEATLHGLACILGAEDSGAVSAYSGSPPYALAVAAVGRLNEFPDKTSDATTAWPITVAADGIFVPSFCQGQHVAVCAPGVAVISTVPGGFQPRSGNAAAASHVTGLAALLLAHHAAFQGPLGAGDQKRVAGLFNMIRLMSVPYAFGAGPAAAGLPRLHGLEQVLQPSPQPQSAETVSAPGNGPAAKTSSIGSVVPVLAPSFSSPLLTPPVASTVVGYPLVDPWVVVPPLGAQPWAFRVLLESGRSPYGRV